MADDLADAYDIPRRKVAQAGYMDRIEAPDGTAFYVVQAGGEDELIHADVVEYEGLLEHPLTTGLLGLLAMLAGPLLVALAAAYGVTLVASTLLQAAVVGIGAVGAYALATLALHRTVAGDWLYRFLEYNDHKYHILNHRGDAV